jgi:DNA-binding CsgD family transcriptional regulator
VNSLLIDRIYECAFVPELWPDILRDLAEIAVARAGFLFISNGDIHHWAASTAIGTEALKPLVESGWIARSERFARLLAFSHSGFLSDSAIYESEEAQAADPSYRDFLYPRGLGRSAATTIPLPTGDRFSIALERENARGPVENAAIDRLDELRPHLARAALMAARLQLERARMASETLGAVGLPAAVLDDQGKVLAANPLIEALTDHVQWRPHDRIALKDSIANKLLRDAIATVDRDGATAVRSFPVRGSEAMMVAHIIPVRRSSRDIFVRCAAMLLLTPVTLPHAPPVELVQSLFDLTPAEARVARGLAGGKTVEDIALDGAVSPNTIRAQVRGVLVKTGCNRQVDVVAMLAGIASIRLGDPA